MTVPFTEHDLGEVHYSGGQGEPGQPDRNLYDQDFHKEFYGKDGPEPFGA